VRVVGSVEIDRPGSEVWAYVANYGNDPSWRAAVTQMRPSVHGPAQVGVTTHELLRLLGMTFRTDATIDRVDAGRLLEWRAHDRQKQLHGSRLVEPTGPASSRFTEVVEGRLLRLSRLLEPLVSWLLNQQATADMRRLKQLLEAPALSGSDPEETPDLSAET
jgi:Polyketide cyclase / dehydrase and lipid transport